MIISRFCKWTNRPSGEDGDRAIFHPGLRSDERFKGAALIEYSSAESSWIVLSTFDNPVYVPIAHNGSFNGDFYDEVIYGPVDTRVTSNDEYAVELENGSKDPRWDVQVPFRLLPSGKAGATFYASDFSGSVSGSNRFYIYTGETIDRDGTTFSAESCVLGGIWHTGSGTARAGVQFFDEQGNNSFEDVNNYSIGPLQRVESGFVRSLGAASGDIEAVGSYRDGSNVGFKDQTFNARPSSIFAGSRFSNGSSINDGEEGEVTIQNFYVEV